MPSPPKDPMYIYIQTTETEYRPGIRILEEEGYPQLLNEFALYVSNILKDELVRAVDNQRYAHDWEPLSVPYYEYKERNNLSLKIWEATSLLKDSIEVLRKRDYFEVGVSKTQVYPGTLVRVYRVARYMEYGTQDMPARPLFRPLVRYIRKNIRRYWNKFASGKGLV